MSLCIDFKQEYCVSVGVFMAWGDRKQLRGDLWQRGVVVKVVPRLCCRCCLKESRTL